MKIATHEEVKAIVDQLDSLLEKAKEKGIIIAVPGDNDPWCVSEITLGTKYLGGKESAIWHLKNGTPVIALVKDGEHIETATDENGEQI